MTEITTAARMTLAEARDLTDEVKADAAALWAKLLRLYEGQAHIALGYSSWAEYCAEEYDWSDATAYRLLGAANVVAQLPIGSPAPATESVARELVPVLREAPEQVAEVWGEVVEEHGEAPTAKQVHEVVKRRPAKRQPRPAPEPPPRPRPSARAFFGHLGAAFEELGAAFGADLSPEERESYRPGIEPLRRIREDLVRFVDQEAS